MAAFEFIDGAEMVVAVCPRCGTKHAFSRAVYDTAKEMAEAGSVYCPHGHPWHYPRGHTPADKLRRERDALKQEQARLYGLINEERERAKLSERTARAYKGQATKMKNRASNGVCPCCNRSFENLRRHMKSKHPNFADLKVIEGGKVA